MKKKISSPIAYCSGSSAGLHHTAEGKTCQDASMVGIEASGWVIAAVADGAGSSQHSHLSSQLAVKTIVDRIAKLAASDRWNAPHFRLEDKFWRETSISLFKVVREEIIRLAKEEKADIEDFNTTLIVACMKGNVLAIAHVGDGRVAVRDQAGNWAAGISPFRGRYSNETVFVTMEDWLSNPSMLETSVTNKEFTGLALLTDGVEHAAFICKILSSEGAPFDDPNIPSKEFWEPLHQQLVSMYRKGEPHKSIQAKWSQFLKRGTPNLASAIDDKTIILIAK